MPPRIITVCSEAFVACQFHAAAATIGGHSQLDERRVEDQLVGQLGNAALSYYMTGSYEKWKLSRMVANQHPKSGDGGSDIPGCNVDIKTSCMRGSMDPMEYHLPVPPEELHEGIVYVLGLVMKPLVPPIDVFLVGWATGEEFTATQDAGTFEGKHIIQARALHLLAPFKWDYRGTEKRRKLDPRIAQGGRAAGS